MSTPAIVTRPATFRTPRALGPGKTTSRSAPCPICKKDGCRVFSDGHGVICRHVPSDRPKNGGFYHAIGDHVVDWRDALAVQTTAAPTAPSLNQPVDDKRATVVYTALLARCTLSDRHRNELHNRGLSDAEIEADGYATLPPGNRAAIVRDVIAAVGDISGVPGFFRRAGCWEIAGRAGLLIPMRPDGGAATRFKIRPDRPGDGGRYVWFSTPDQDGGAGSGAVGHLAIPEPRGCLRTDESDGPGTTRRLWITEGPIKANIAARKLGAPVFAVPGVNAQEPMIAAMPAWRDQGITDVVLAFDADRATNKDVATAHDVAAATLAAAGFNVLIASWAPTHKGIDDALVAGAVIQIERSRQDEDLLAEIAALKAVIAELKAEVARMSGAFRASRSPQMGTATAIVADLDARVQTGEWMAQPHARTEELTGKSSDTIARDLKRMAPLLAGFLEQELRTVKGSHHPVTFRRLTRPASECFAAIQNYATPKPTAPVGEDDTIPVVIETDQRVYRADGGELLSEVTRRRTGRRPRPHADQDLTGPQTAVPFYVYGGDEIDAGARQPAPDLTGPQTAVLLAPPPALAAPNGNAPSTAPHGVPLASVATSTFASTRPERNDAPDISRSHADPPIASISTEPTPADAHNRHRSNEGRRPAVRIHDDPLRRAGNPPAFGTGAAFGTAGYDMYTEA